MKNKVISLVIAVALIVTFSIPCFGTDLGKESIAQKGESAETVADIVEQVTGTEGLLNSYVEDEDYYTVEENDIAIGIPKDGSDAINFDLENENNTMQVELPDIVDESEAQMTEDGTAVFESKEESVSVEVQAYEEKEKNISFDCLRELITINDANSPHEYSFTYDLPEGYRIVTSEEYYKMCDYENPLPGWVFIVDTNSFLASESEEDNGLADNEIVLYIEPAWAKDAAGCDVDTYYSVEGETLTQIIGFDENDCFPIVADPANKKPKAEKVCELQGSTSVKLAEICTILGVVEGVKEVRRLLKEGKRTKDIINALESKLKSKVKSKALKKGLAVAFASKAASAVGVAAAFGSFYLYFKGYDKVTFSYDYEQWTTYKHQGGRWVKGYTYKMKSFSKKWA